MRIFSIFILTLFVHLVKAQSTSFGASTSVNVEGNAMFYFQSGATLNGLVSNDGQVIVEGDMNLNSTLDNNGLIVIGGNANLTPTSSFANNAGSILAMEGVATLDGTLINDGELNVFGGSTIAINGNFANNSEALFEGDADFNGLIDNIGLIVVGGNASSGSLSTFNNLTEFSVWGIEGNAVLDGTIENDGLIDILGESTISSAALFNNNAGAIWSSEGNASLDGTITNNGEFYVINGAQANVTGSLDNNNEMTLEGDTEVAGILNNTGFMNVIENLAVTGTWANQDGATTIIGGDLDQVTAFENGGIVEVNGEALFSDSFTNKNEMVLTGISAFEGAILNEQKLYLGGNAQFVGDLTNNGEIISFADAELNYEHNRNLGNLSFTDVDQVVPIDEVTLASSADSIFINQLSLNIEGKVTLPTNFVLIQDELAIQQGVLNTTNQENFLVAGNVNVNSATGAPAYVEGKMLAVTTSGTTTFPMGINGNPNYITLNSSKAGVTIKVECKLPNPDSLLTDENTMGLAPDVEWTIQSLSDSAEMTVSVAYSGVDFTNAPNFINAREYDATLQRYDRSDSLYHALRTVESINNNTGTSVPTEGTIKTADQIWITTKFSKFALGLSPVLTEPEVYLPNVFTPNASMSDNQIFRPFIGGAIVNAVDFAVFDSFNSEIYSSSQTGDDLDLESIGWDGILKNGQDAPEGVYYYKVNIEYLISEDVSDKYFNSGERGQTQSFSKLGSVMLVK